jgi:hypothetical protein
MVALIVTVTVRTGDVVDSAGYLLVPRAGGRLALVGRLQAAGCYGQSARVLTPVFGGPGAGPLRVAIKTTGRVRLVLRARGRQIAAAQVPSRPRHSVIFRIAADDVPPGAVSIRITGRSGSFVLGAVRAR